MFYFLFKDTNFCKTFSLIILTKFYDTSVEKRREYIEFNEHMLSSTLCVRNTNEYVNRKIYIKKNMLIYSP